MRSRKARECSVLTVLAATTCLTPAPPVRAQEIDQAKALKVKAAYVYNFAKFIEWPAGVYKDAESPFVIGVVGDDSFLKNLNDTVRAKKIATRPVTILRLRWGTPADRAKLKRCRILYISKTERRRLTEIFGALKGKPVLLVSDIPGFASGGGMIGFVLEQQRIIFEINREALEQAKLKTSAKLLKLARIVQTKDRRTERSPANNGKP